jgi:transcriptional regulator CtsR
MSILVKGGVLVMNDSNMSDNIETYLKQILQQAHEIEIRRVELAQRFNVVPSQINYVIKTRFNTENIRIVEMALRNEPRLIEEIKQQLPKIVSFRTATSVISSLCREQILTVHESELILTLLSKETLSVGDVTVQGQLRARLLQQLLSRLRFESERN